MSDLHALMLTEVAAKIRAREVSATEVTAHMLARIERLDGTLRSYATVTADVATAQAARVDEEVAAGTVRGPLHGVPFGLKDLCATKDAPTHVGSVALRDWSPGVDCTVTARLREAGAVFVGKLQMTEGAYAVHHPSIAPPVNPWHPDYWTGVSSSGSGVATTARLCYGSLGTDTGGSIRFPSQACGVTGLKPTWGRVSRAGAFALSETLDHIGPMARSAADCAAILGVIAGVDPDDPTTVQGAGAGLPRRHRRRHQGHAHRPRRGLLLGRRGRAGDRHDHAGGRRAAGAWCRHQADRLPRRDGHGRALERFLRRRHGHRARALLCRAQGRLRGRCWPA